VAVVWADVAGADTEWHVGIQPALALDAPESGLRPAFAPSATVDLSFGRDRAGQVAWGPRLEIGSWAFRDLRTSAFGHVMLPLGPLDVDLAAGPQWQLGRGAGAAAAARLFLGYRAFNHSGSYGTGFGFFGGLDATLGDTPTTFLLGLHLDGMWSSIPILALVSWIRGAPDE
jgi:hypothetical protein